MFTCPVESSPNEASFQALFKSHSLCHSLNPISFLEALVTWYAFHGILVLILRWISTALWVSRGPPWHNLTAAKFNPDNAHSTHTSHPSGCLPALGTLTASCQVALRMDKSLLYSVQHRSAQTQWYHSAGWDLLGSKIAQVLSSWFSMKYKVYTHAC